MFKSLSCMALLSAVTLLNANQVQILSAVEKDKKIEGATVIFQKTGEQSIQSRSDGSGNAHYDAAFDGIDGGDTLMLIKKEGYSTLVAKCPCDGLTYALSPVMQDLDGMRIVLNWGRSPSDLDSHLVYPDNHVFYSAKQGSQAHLDVDDTDSFGPETITIVKKKSGEKYVYAVHDFSDSDQPTTLNLGKSSASVRVYVGQTLIRTYNARPGAAGNTWVVFGIDENGAFHDIERYIETNGGGAAILPNLKPLIRGESFASDLHITDAQIQRAKKLNAKGEKVYHEQRLEDAMYLFQEAVNLDPQFGQAYSNLGLTYQKLGRDAEAIWANRKAIERAYGNNAERVKASSYYNIARVYEKQGKYADALANFEKALQNREHSAYRKGIDRMRQQLQNH